jgi:hypothetical protein
LFENLGGIVAVDPAVALGAADDVLGFIRRRFPEESTDAFFPRGMSIMLGRRTNYRGA